MKSKVENKKLIFYEYSQEEFDELQEFLSWKGDYRLSKTLLMVNFATLIGAQVLLKKLPHQEVFEAQILGVSANEQFVKLKLSDGRTAWEEAEILQLADQLG